MAKYKVLADSVIGPGLVKAGEIIEYDGVSEGKPGDNLELIVEEPPKRPQATAQKSGGE